MVLTLAGELADRDLSPLGAPAAMAAMAERLGDVFYDFGAESVEVLRLSATAGWTRLDLLEDATGLFLAGSGSSWLQLPDGIPLGETVRRRHAAGMAVGGSGAGAAILGEQCLAPAVAPTAGRRRSLGLAPGLGLLPGLLLDPAQRQRDRLGRLLAALAVDPTLLAVGLDEDTALLVDGAATLEVRGGGAAMVVDAAEAVRSAPPRATGDPLPMLGLRVDFLTVGCRYDLRERRGRPGAAHAHGTAAAAADRMLPEPDKPQGE
ncbi:MAG TPA: cyanophycinase [Thermoanaerobaculia bacterium]|nr:cyanophycinase [Thermoanaerobaculia bacterium]